MKCLDHDRVPSTLNIRINGKVQYVVTISRTTSTNTQIDGKSQKMREDVNNNKTSKVSAF